MLALPLVSMGRTKHSNPAARYMEALTNIGVLVNPTYVAMIGACGRSHSQCCNTKSNAG